MPKIGDTIPAHVTLGKSAMEKAMDSLNEQIRAEEVKLEETHPTHSRRMTDVVGITY